MNKLTKENITIGHEKLVQLVKICKQYDDPFTVDFENRELKNAILLLKQKLSDLPDLFFEMKTTLRYATHGIAPYGDYPSYYTVRIPEIYYQLKTKGYYVFFHEMTEFLEYEILGGEMDDTEIVLSYAVKNALIGMIEKAESKGIV